MVRETVPVAEALRESRLSKVKNLCRWMLLPLLATPAVVAQTLSFEGTWGGCTTEAGQMDRATGVAVGPDGSIYVVGRTNVNAFGFPLEDALIVKFDPSDLANNWQRKWGGTGQDTATAVAVGSEGAIYVVERTLSFSAQVFILRLDPATGDLVWQRNWGFFPGGVDVGTGVAIAPDGSVLYVVGNSDGAGGTFILQIDPSTGDLLLQKRWTGGSVTGTSEFGDPVAVSPDGSLYLAENTTPAASSEPFILRLNPADLSLIWGNAWVDALSGDASFGLAANDGGAVMVGSSASESQNFLVKLDPDGGLLLQRSLSTTGLGGFRDVAVGSDDSVALVAGVADIQVLRLTSEGDVVFRGSVAAPPAITDSPLVELQAGNIYVAGTVSVPTAGIVDGLILVPLPNPVPDVPSGVLIALTTDTSGFDPPFPIYEDPSGAMYEAATGVLGPPVPACGFPNDETFAIRISLP